MSRLQLVLTVVALGAVLGMTGCREAVTLTATNFDVQPNPAFPGDQVEVSFVLTLLPVQSHTMIVFIGEAEHMRVTRDRTPPIPVRLDVGDAADLISEYGVGNHTVSVEIHANHSDQAIETQSRTLELRESPR